MISEHRKIRDEFAEKVEEAIKDSFARRNIGVRRVENLIEVKFETVTFNVIVTVKRGSQIDG